MTSQMLIIFYKTLKPDDSQPHFEQCCQIKSEALGPTRLLWLIIEHIKSCHPEVKASESDKIAKLFLILPFKITITRRYRMHNLLFNIQNFMGENDSQTRKSPLHL